MVDAPAARATPTPALGELWWVALVAGVVTMIVGLITLVYPGPTLLVIAIIFGAYLVIWGALTIFRGIAGEDRLTSAARVLWVLLGVLTVLAGLIVMVRPEKSVLLAAWVLGFWWVLAGVIRLVGGIAEPEGRGWNIALGVLGIAAGTIILAQPQIGLITLVWIVGIGLLLQGAIEIVASLQIRKLRKQQVQA